MGHKRRQEGDKWILTASTGVQYERMKKDGKAITLRRITPYIDPNKANKKSGVPTTAGKPKSDKCARMKARKEGKLVPPPVVYKQKQTPSNMRKVMVQVDRRTWIEKWVPIEI